MKLSKTDYRGGEALRLTTSKIELVIPTQLGPRITSLRSLSGRAGNLFLEFPENEKRYHGYFLRGGHRLWHAPEDIVRTYQPDDDPLELKMLPRGVALTQRPERLTGLQKRVVVEVIGDRAVKVTHSLTNRNLWPVECAPWVLTMLRPGGIGVVPFLPKGSHEDGDLLPNYSLVPWSFTDLSLPLWRLNRDFISVDVAKARTAQKLGITAYPGWSAYWVDGTAFVKYAAVVRGARYPDLGSCFEVFTNGQFLELETLGPLGPLAPGRTVTHVEFWGVLDAIAKPTGNAAFSNSLAPAVKSWQSRLK